MAIRVILSNLYSRKTFDIYNILVSLGIETINISSCSWARGLCYRIAYGKHVFRDVGVSDIESIVNICAKNQKDKFVLFSIEESTMQQLYGLKKSPPKNLLFYFPPNDSFILSRNKKLFSDFCARNNFPIPQEYSYEELETGGIPTGGIIVKPSIGTGSEGIIYIETMEQLWSLKNLNFDECIIQEKINQDSPVEAAFFLCKEGEVLSYYGHRRIRTFPKKGGVTVFSKCALNEALFDIGSLILKKMNWSGFAMIEFMYDIKSEQYKIIELNPRIWGSIMLSEFCGANFLQSYVNLCLDKKVPKPAIDEDVFIRWIFPYDVIFFIKNGFKSIFFREADKRKTCLINFSYSTKLRSLVFLTAQFASLRNLKKIINKIF